MLMALVAVIKMVCLFLIPGLIIFGIGYILSEVCGIGIEEFNKLKCKSSKSKGEDE